MSQMNEHHDNGLNMCSIKSPNASPFADSINNLSSCSQVIINLIFSNQYYILFPSFRMRLAIHCVHMLNLGSASGVTLRIVDVCCRIGTRLVCYFVCMWNLSSTFSVTCRSVDVCAGIGMRLIIYCIHMWNSGSASGVTR